MKIVWLATAEQDVESLIDYISQHNSKAALQTFSTIRLSIEKLAKYPFAGREGRIPDTRELVVPQLPYIVIYTITENIVILALIHTSRKWPKRL